MRRLVMIVMVVGGIGCGGAAKSGGGDPAAPDPGATATAKQCVEKADAPQGCAYGVIELDTTTATKVEGAGRSETCIGLAGSPHECAWEMAQLPSGDTPGTIGTGSGTGTEPKTE